MGGAHCSDTCLPFLIISDLDEKASVEGCAGIDAFRRRKVKDFKTENRKRIGEFFSGPRIIGIGIGATPGHKRRVLVNHLNVMAKKQKVNIMNWREWR